jgi:hypothetical protein
LGYISKVEHLSSINEVPGELENYLVGLEVTHIIIILPPKESIFLNMKIKEVRVKFHVYRMSTHLDIEF